MENIWQRNRDGREEWKEVNLNSNRETLEFIQRYFPDKLVTAQDISRGLGISLESARMRLKRLHNSNFLRSKKVKKSWVKTKPIRVYALSKKGLKQLPLKKPREKEVIVKEIEKPIVETKTVFSKEEILGER